MSRVTATLGPSDMASLPPGWADPVDPVDPAEPAGSTGSTGSTEAAEPSSSTDQAGPAIPTMLMPGEWTEGAICRGEDPELFFPIGTAGLALEQVDMAKKVCAQCPVRRTCLEWALDTGEAHGIWGGTTPEERRSLRRSHSRPARPVVVDHAV